MKLQSITIINGMRNNMKMPPGAHERHAENVRRQQGGGFGAKCHGGVSRGERGQKLLKKASYDLWMIPNSVFHTLVLFQKDDIDMSYRQ